MSKTRLEAFSDGVIAIIITIMVLELRVPAGTDWQALRPTVPVFFTYAMSFIFLGVYWNNHHHMLHVTHRVNGKILWANLHLLFWLSLTPVATGWLGRSHLAPLPTAVYGGVMILSALAYTILLNAILAHEGPDSKLATAVKNDLKGKLSIALYAVAIPTAFFQPWISVGIYVAVICIWFVPDRRIESRLDG